MTGFDPSADLARRADRWGHRLGVPDLDRLARFAAGLARAEAEAWERDDPVIATRAFEERRFLAGDRIVHWAVPWLDAAGRAYPEVHGPSHGLRDLLLELGDRLRLAPHLTGAEGTTLPGHDSLGPLEPDRPWEEWLASLLSGAVIMRSRPGSHLVGTGRGLAQEYRDGSVRWQRLAEHHPGTAGLWLDLAARAARTAHHLEERPV